MSFCKACPAHTNCCTGKTVDLPILTPKDVNRISAATGLDPEDFSKNSDGALRPMKAGYQGCFFYESGRCKIYDSRPTDCRMFPFDVDRAEDGSLIWIVYSSTCPVSVDASEYFPSVQELEQELDPYLAEFATHTSARMEQHESQVIGPVARKDSVARLKSRLTRRCSGPADAVR